MRTGIVACTLALAAACAWAAPAFASQRTSARAGAGHARPAQRRPDPAAAWVGRDVRVDTVDHGLYLGTLQAVGADSLVLDIVLPAHRLRYTLPRSAVAEVTPLTGPSP
jgi:hypothetical protein